MARPPAGGLRRDNVLDISSATAKISRGARILPDKSRPVAEIGEPHYDSGPASKPKSKAVAKESGVCVYSMNTSLVNSVLASEMHSVPRPNGTAVAEIVSQLESQLAKARQECLLLESQLTETRNALSSLKSHIASGIGNALKSSAVLKRKLNGSTDSIISLVISAVHSELARGRIESTAGDGAEEFPTSRQDHCDGASNGAVYANSAEILAALAPAFDALSLSAKQAVKAAVKAAVERDLAPPETAQDEIEQFRITGTTLLKDKLNGQTDRVMAVATGAVAAAIEHQEAMPTARPTDEKPWRVVTARWPKDAKGRNPVQFIKDEYGAWMKPDMTGITLSDVADNDDEGTREHLLRKAFYSFTRRSPEKKIPADFHLPTIEQKNDALIALACQGGNLPDDFHARSRLANAASKRGISLRR